MGRRPRAADPAGGDGPDPGDGREAALTRRAVHAPAFAFVLTIGVVNLFADMTYEGGAAINGQFLASLGASAAAISIVAGVGEFLGYALRSVAGYVADRTGRHWLVTFIGYAVNLLAVPAMALATGWAAAGVLILAERAGRALRKPTIEAMLSYTTARYGPGRVYSINTALDETGAALGPLLAGLALYLNAGMRAAYGWLLVPALLALVMLVAARSRYPIAERLGEGAPDTARAEGFTRAYWLYMIGGGCFAAGLMSFELVAFHLSRTGTVEGALLPVLLSAGTVAAIVASLVLGRLFDRIGAGAVVAAVLVAAGYPFLVVFGGFWPVVLGILLWGVAYATQDTLMKVLIASVLPRQRRNLAFGLFYLGYGGGWLVGSVASGLLYERSRLALAAFSAAALLASIPFFLMGKKSNVHDLPGEPGRA